MGGVLVAAGVSAAAPVAEVPHRGVPIAGLPAGVARERHAVPVAVIAETAQPEAPRAPVPWRVRGRPRQAVQGRQPQQTETRPRHAASNGK